MIFNNGQFLGEDYTDDQLRAIAKSRAAAASVGVQAAEAAGAAAAQTQARTMQRASDLADLRAGMPAPWYRGRGMLIAGGVGVAGLALFLLTRPKARARFQSRPKKK